MHKPKQIRLGELAAALSLPVPGNADLLLAGVNNLLDAGEHDLSFMGSDQYLKEFAQTRAAVVIVPRKANLPADKKVIVLRADDVDIATAKALALFAPERQRPAGVHPTAVIASPESIPSDAAIGPCAVIGRNVKIGARCAIHAGVSIGDDVTIGDDCEFWPNVVIRERISIGSRVTINAGSVIGTDGFGYRWDGKKHMKVPQIGTVIIEDDVELGSCVCIDRAKVGATVVGRGTKVDNLVQIAHNVKTGAHCIMAGQAGIAGSTVLGNGVVLGGAASVRDHVTLGDGAMVAARSAVHEDVPAKSVVSGMPALPHRQTLREQAAFRRLPELMVQMRKIQEQIENYLKANGQDPEDILGQ